MVKPIQCQTDRSKESYLEKRHKYHPPSKLCWVGNKKSSEEENERYNSRVKENEKVFRLMSQSHTEVRSRQLFSKFYSGGPTKQSNLNHLNAILLIQKNVRKFL